VNLLGYAAEPPSRVPVTVLALPHEDVPDELAERVLRGLSRALGKNVRLDVKDASKLLADFAGDTPTADVEAARALSKQGEDLLANLNTREALEKLAEAVQKLERVMPYIHKQELAEATLSLAVAQGLEGNRAAAQKTFADLLVWRPKVDEDATRVPPSLMKLYEDTRREVARLPRGSLEVRSEPDGAQVYVDGHYTGVTPTTAEGLFVGYHFITFKKEAYLKQVVRAQVSARRQEVVSAQLERSSKYLLLQQSLERSREGFGARAATEPMAELRSYLFIDQVIFVRMQLQKPRVQIDAALYDLRSRRRLSQVHQVVSPDRAQRAADTLAQSLYVGVSYDGALPAPAPEKPPEVTRPRPFYARWWFWTAIGLATAAAIIIPLGALPEDRSTPGFTSASLNF